VFRTEDGRRGPGPIVRNTDARAFYDCITFFDSRTPGDERPGGRQVRILSTGDGGRS